MPSDHQASVTRLIELSLANRELVAELEKFRRHMTVMFTDIRGSTAYFEKYGDVAGLLMVHECNKALRGIVEQHGGRVHKTIGDAIMASFVDCEQAVEAAIAMEKQLASMNASKPGDHRTLVRIGLHYGMGVVKSDDVFGDVVNVASRVESVASPEQILISEKLFEQVQHCGFNIVSLGRFQLKGKEADCGLFEVVWRQRAAPLPVVTHSVFSGSTGSLVGKLKLQHLTSNGNVDAECELRNRITVGRTQGDLTFPADPLMAPLNVAFSLEDGQVFVENLSPEGRVFVRLISVYTLQDQDVIMMGKQVFEFRQTPDAMALGAMMGATLANMTAMLKAPVAQFVLLNSDGSPGTSYPLTEEEVKFGRVGTTYAFPNDRLLSHTHARVYQRGEDFFLEDAGSRNGIFVKVRAKTPLPVGGTVLAGQQLLRVSD